MEETTTTETTSEETTASATTEPLQNHADKPHDHTETGTESTETASEETTATEDKALEGREKALHDTQAAFTRKAQEAAEAKKQIDALQAELETLRTTPRITDAKVQEAWAKVQEQYKDIPEMGPMLSFLEAITGGIGAHEKSLADVMGRIEMARAHPDANEVFQSDDFLLWMAKSPEMRELLDGSVKDKITALNFYKLGRGKDAAEAKAAEMAKQKKADELKAPSSTTGGPSPKEMTEEEYWKSRYPNTQF